MPRFDYTALTQAGNRITGQMDASTPEAAIAELQRSGHFPLKAVPAKAGLASLLRGRLWPVAASGSALSVMTHELAMLLGAGLPLPAALDLVTGLAPDRRLKDAFGQIRDQVRRGTSLAEAIEAHAALFPRYYAALVRAGEAGGALEVTLVRLSEHLARANAVREHVKSAMIYPVILLVTAGLAIIFILTTVLPQFKPMFAEAGAELPASTRIVMAIGDFVTSWGWAMLMLAILGIFALRRALAEPTLRRRWDAGKLRLPWFGTLIAEAETGRFARTLGTLIQSGVTLPTALGIARETLGNAALRHAAGEAAISLRAGEGLASLLSRSRLFPALASQLVKVGEETGRLDEMLVHQAGLFERRVARGVDRMVAALVPGLTVVLGAVVAGIIASVLSAMLAINNLAS